MSSEVGKLYKMEISPPCRAVILTAKALNIDLELVEINLFKGEQFSQEFLRLNPHHSVPTYVDHDGTTIGDSHAIMAYLASKYGKDDSLYPKDLGLRAAVDQRLHFDTGSVYALHKSIIKPMYAKVTTRPNQTQLALAESMYTTLNTFLVGNNWVAGSTKPTIADLSLIASIGAISVVAPFDKEKFVNIEAWIKRCEALPYFEVNKKGLDIYTSILDDMMNGKHDFLS